MIGFWLVCKFGKWEKHSSGFLLSLIDFQFENGICNAAFNYIWTFKRFKINNRKKLSFGDNAKHQEIYVKH